MGLLEDLGNESNFPNVRRAWCSVCELLKKLPEKESQALKVRLDNANITHMSISLVLKNNDYAISDSTIGRHRRGRCTGVAR
jgi:hypothetical protein